MSRFEGFTTEELDMLTDACHVYYCEAEEVRSGEYADAIWKLYQEGIEEWKSRSDREDDE